MRVNVKIKFTGYQKNLVAYSAREIAAFIKVSPEQHRKIAELICSVVDSMGSQGITLLRDFTQAVAKGTLQEFSNTWSEKKVPMSILSDLLAISQEMEANTRERVDDLILKAKRGAIEFGKHSFTKAVALLIL